MKIEYNEALTETFLRYYRELESIRDMAPEEYVFYQRKYSREFEGFRQIRNFLSHEAYKAKDCVAVSSAVVEDIVRIQKEMGRSVYDITSKKIIAGRPSMPFHDALELMSENDLTYLPILENDKSVLGVISANDILDLLVIRTKFPRELLVDDFLTDIDALVADVRAAGPRDQLSDLVLGFAAERASDFLIRHKFLPFHNGCPGVSLYA